MAQNGKNPKQLLLGAAASRGKKKLKKKILTIALPIFLIISVVAGTVGEIVEKVQEFIDWLAGRDKTITELYVKSAEGSDALDTLWDWWKTASYEKAHITADALELLAKDTEKQKGFVTTVGGKPGNTYFYLNRAQAKKSGISDDKVNSIVKNAIKMDAPKNTAEGWEYYKTEGTWTGIRDNVYSDYATPWQFYYLAYLQAGYDYDSPEEDVESFIDGMTEQLNVEVQIYNTPLARALSSLSPRNPQISQSIIDTSSTFKLSKKFDSKYVKKNYKPEKTETAEETTEAGTTEAGTTKPSETQNADNSGSSGSKTGKSQKKKKKIKVNNKKNSRKKQKNATKQTGKNGKDSSARIKPADRTIVTSSKSSKKTSEQQTLASNVNESGFVNKVRENNSLAAAAATPEKNKEEGKILPSNITESDPVNTSDDNFGLNQPAKAKTELNKKAKEKKEKERKKAEKNTKTAALADDTATFTYPLGQYYVVTSPYEASGDSPYHTNDNAHNGVDIGAPGGTPIYAVTDGKVLISSMGWNYGRGNFVAQSIDAKGFEDLRVIYQHCSSLAVKEGETVKQGQLIGYVGNSGAVSGSGGGYHLHIEFDQLKNGKWEDIDPAPYMNFYSTKPTYAKNMGRAAESSSDSSDNIDISLATLDAADSEQKSRIERYLTSCTKDNEITISYDRLTSSDLSYVSELNKNMSASGLVLDKAEGEGVTTVPAHIKWFLGEIDYKYSRDGKTLKKIKITPKLEELKEFMKNDMGSKNFNFDVLIAAAQNIESFEDVGNMLETYKYMAEHGTAVKNANMNIDVSETDAEAIRTGNIVGENELAMADTSDLDILEQLAEKSTVYTDDAKVDLSKIDLNDVNTFNKDQATFIRAIGELARGYMLSAKEQNKNYILPSVIISQAITESSWGKTAPAVNGNNFFGMKATPASETNDWWFGERANYSTDEDDGTGNRYTIQADFRVYDTPENAVGDLVRRHLRYCSAERIEQGMKGDAYAFVDGVVESGYATATNYKNAITRGIGLYDLTRYDRVPLELTVSTKEAYQKAKTTAPSTAGTLGLSDKVEAMRSDVEAEMKKYGQEKYTDLALAVVMQESRGETNNPWQVKTTGMGHTQMTPKISLERGASILCDCIKKAGVKNTNDENGIRLALQGYNFGSGYIDYAMKNGGKWTQKNVDSFAEEKAKENGIKPRTEQTDINSMGKWGYGDQHYTDHVLKYYKFGSTLGLGTSEVTDASKVKNTTEDRVKYLFPDGEPQNEEEIKQYLTTILVPYVDTRGKDGEMRITVHKKIAKEVLGAFQDMKDIRFKINDKTTYCYKWRGKVGADGLSHHSYGACIDINPEDNPLYKAAKNDGRTEGNPLSVTKAVVKIWKRHGFSWGGDFTNGNIDPMHFTYTRQ